MKEAIEAKENLTKRQMQALKTKNKIYQAAVQEINEKGFNNVNIEDITKAAEVAKGTFYVHFDSKEAIILYTFEHSDEIYEEAYEKIEGESFLIWLCILSATATANTRNAARASSVP